jgi:protease-4
MRFLSTLAASTLGTLAACAILFVLGLTFLFAVAAASDPAPAVRPGSVLVAELAGSWPESVSGDPLARALGGEAALDLHDVTRGLRRAAADRRIGAVWLRLGGVTAPWASLQAVRRQIEAVRLAGKPVYATSDTYMVGEKDYFLASVADSVFLDSESLFEFNGFRASVVFYAGLLERADIQPQAIRAGRFKSAVEPFLRSDLSEDGELQLRAVVSDIEEHFVAAVASSRNLEPERVRQLLGDADVGSARDALGAGLIDRLLFADQVEDLLADRLDQDSDARLRTVKLRDYARVPDASAGMPTGREGEIAVVYAEGDIVAGRSGGPALPGVTGRGLGAETFAEAMREARRTESVDAVVVRVNSPGGFAPAADAMRREIELTAAEKPVILSMGDVAASGGYWMATAADTLVAEELTITGSIGVFSLLFDFSGLFERHLGVTFDGVQTGPSADAMSFMRPLTAQETARMERDIDQVYQSFLEKVSESRGMTIDEVDGLAQGRVWTGRDALDRGLVDVLGGLSDAVDLAAARAGLAPGTFRVRELPRPRSFLERLAGTMETRMHGFARSLGFGMDPRLEALVAEMGALQRLSGSPQARMEARIEVH